jgi:hypothetical protein
LIRTIKVNDFICFWLCSCVINLESKVIWRARMQKEENEVDYPSRKSFQANIREIPRGWWKLDLLGRIITNGVDEMEYEIGFGYVLI